MLKKFNLPLMGGFLAGIAASLCCVGPLVLFSLGIGGAWVSNLTAFEPYRPIFIVIAIFALVIAYFQLYLPVAEPCCNKDSVCTQRLYKHLFWGVVVVVLVAIASPYLISFIYG